MQQQQNTFARNRRATIDIQGWLCLLAWWIQYIFMLCFAKFICCKTFWILISKYPRRNIICERWAKWKWYILNGADTLKRKMHEKCTFAHMEVIIYTIDNEHQRHERRKKRIKNGSFHVRSTFLDWTILFSYVFFGAGWMVNCCAKPIHSHKILSKVVPLNFVQLYFAHVWL